MTVQLVASTVGLTVNVKFKAIPGQNYDIWSLQVSAGPYKLTKKLLYFYPLHNFLNTISEHSLLESLVITPSMMRTYVQILAVISENVE